MASYRSRAKINFDLVILTNSTGSNPLPLKKVLLPVKDGRLGHLGLDVYEEEADLFFEDLSDKVIQDDVFARLLSFPNVLVTGHQAFFTADALQGIAGTTIANITAFERDGRAVHEISVEKLA